MGDSVDDVREEAARVIAGEVTQLALSLWGDHGQRILNEAETRMESWSGHDDGKVETVVRETSWMSAFLAALSYLLSVETLDIDRFEQVAFEAVFPSVERAVNDLAFRGGGEVADHA